MAPPHPGSRTKDIGDACQCVIVGGGHLTIPACPSSRCSFLEVLFPRGVLSSRCSFLEALFPRGCDLCVCLATRRLRLLASLVLGCAFFTCRSVCLSVCRVVRCALWMVSEQKLAIGARSHVHKTHESRKSIRNVIHATAKAGSAVSGGRSDASRRKGRERKARERERDAPSSTSKKLGGSTRAHGPLTLSHPPLGALGHHQTSLPPVPSHRVSPSPVPQHAGYHVLRLTHHMHPTL